ncbi:hypothetical protein FNF27_00938 [Cafeteria roenbergensis]|uniref:PI3K/PI4K catalytic domain-containing protein n=1 Tax=Cafeteria roenbergensis TaxID=33653 RepID=A0A5A8EM78_CAFRO|nr:hypothetical protein FNF27_00938 [Cafeteria roenbergensis]
MVAKEWGIREDDQLLMFRGRVIPPRGDVRVDMLGIEGHDFLVLASVARLGAVAERVASGIDLLVEDVEPCAMKRLFQRRLEEAQTRAAEARARPRHMNASGVPVPSLRALPLGRWSPPMVQLLRRCHAGLDSQRDPEQIVDGEGGSYFLVDHTARRPNMAVLKPRDEEAFAPNNPKRSTGSLGQISHREGVLSGEAWEREVAACSLDQSGFIGVPLTGAVLAVLPALNNGSEVEEVPDVICRALEGGVPTQACSAETAGIFPKVASFQQFMPSAGSMDGHGFSRISVEDAQKVAAFDMFMVNADRHADNLLLAEVADPAPGWRLVPIDHGLTLPHVLGINPESFVWSSEQLDPQLARPILPHVRAWILERDVDQDASMLRSELGIREHCLLNFRIAGRLLQRCVKAGLTLRDAVSFFCRPSSESPSRLETLADSARRRCEFQLVSTNRKWGGRSSGARGRANLAFTKSFDGSLPTPGPNQPGARTASSGTGPSPSARFPATARVQSLPYESTGSQEALEQAPPTKPWAQPASVDIGASARPGMGASDPERTLETGEVAAEAQSRSASPSDQDSQGSEGVASASPLGTALLSRGRSDSPGAMESSPASTAKACGDTVVPTLGIAV